MMSFRRQTIEVRIGPVAIGGGFEGGSGEGGEAGFGGGGEVHPVAVQSMCDTDTNDIEASVDQIGRLRDAGCRIVRLTTQGMREAASMREIVRRVRERWPDVAIVADVHFQPAVALELAGVVDKVRINPGNYENGSNGDGAEEALPASAELPEFVRLVDKCRRTGTAIRIGVNHGSLSQRVMEQYGDTPAGMVASAMRFLRVCRERDFDRVVVSMKASNTRVMVAAYRELVRAMDAADMHYPLHLGVTEAGSGLEGRVKSAVGIGALLTDGLGDTIRVSLTEPPENEIDVARAILQACGLDRSRTEFIACPGCGRTLFSLSPVLEEIKAAVGHLAGLKIAVMGCIVNGPGEMADADYGYVGAGPGRITLYRGREVVRRNVPQSEALEALIELLKADGVWTERNADVEIGSDAEVVGGR
ncbi:MAG: (E)-4-hydroxy-3-methylbut-2-enyl-diphosphate synthase [Alistipes sp.]|jgi:(E)-4-hydroxy-3-methylbut-2-enyl-diphosphate synthase|nr:(E)-4-hydroxy-3-methylbut-2-enyl-diphosphate synthase [Alistipes sp.]